MSIHLLKNLLSMLSLLFTKHSIERSHLKSSHHLLKTKTQLLIRDQREKSKLLIEDGGSFELPIKITFKPEYNIPPLTVDHDLSFNGNGQFKSSMVYFNKEVLNKLNPPKKPLIAPKPAAAAKPLLAQKPKTTNELSSTKAAARGRSMGPTRELFR